MGRVELVQISKHNTPRVGFLLGVVHAWNRIATRRAKPTWTTMSGDVQYLLLVGNGQIVEVHPTASIGLIGEALRERMSRVSIERDESGARTG